MSCCEGFRLTGSPSECSMRSKARIDALFEDSRSICSSNFGGCCSKGAMPLVVSEDPATEEQQRKVNSAVQARIEAMFASVEAESGTPGECAAAILPVRYMGAAPVGGRVASVRGLQEPLRQLVERISDSIPAELEVSRRGLTFRTSEIFEKNNPFRRIAVWSALRLSRKNVTSSNVHHAFIPLVGDEHGTGSEEKHADLYRSMRGLSNKADAYPAIFAVVMRRPGAARLLECHAFACHNEEDAVAAAATLYRALLADMDANHRRPRQSNGVGCVSLASVVSSAREGGCYTSSPPSQTGPEHPIRPPRMKKNSLSRVFSGAEDEDSNRLEKAPRRRKKVSEIRAEDVLEARSRNSEDLEKPNEEKLKKNKEQDETKKQKTEVSDEANEISHSQEHECGTLENSLYEKSDDFKDADKIYSLGQEDVYLTRSQTNGENKKNERRVSRDQRSAYSCGSSISTLDRPLQQKHDFGNQPRPRRRRSRAGSEPPVSRTEGIIELVEDPKLKRSQSDVDVEKGDPMTRVELPRRSSFLNPGTKRRTANVKDGTPLGFTELFDEFRNQEGLTSVDDILAAIIDPEGMSFNDLKPLYKEFLLKLASTLTQDELYQRSASIMRRRRRPQRRRSSRRPCLLSRAIKRSVSRLKSGPTEFTSVIFSKPNDSLGSSSSCDLRNNQRNRVLSSRLNGRRALHRRGHVTSEDSDTCRRLANRSSSGYVSCSECSYDSETCTCVSADKCYCSLSKKIPVAPETAIICACDTDSCSESNKCYCQRRPEAQPTILEQLKQRGIVPCDHTLSRRASASRHLVPVSRSLEYLKEQSSLDNLALDYELFRSKRKPQTGSAGEKILVVSARDPHGRLVYVGGPGRDKKPLKSSSGRSTGHHEVLSIKKSAEIAAVFGSRSSRQCRRVNSASSLRSSISLEAGLGYLP